jgi:hypothetical protein
VPSERIYLLNSGIDWKEKLMATTNFYYDDSPNHLTLENELLIWQMYWEDYTRSLPDIIASTLKAIKPEAFENIKVILRILGMLPITSCECEHSISVLWELKDYKRSTMVSEPPKWVGYDEDP